LTELLTKYGPIQYLWVDHAAGTGGLSHAEFLTHCKALQPGCFVGFNHGDQVGADIRIGEMGRPGPLTDHAAAGPHMRDAPASTYLLAEFTYPILPPHKGGAMWFYSLPEHDGLCLPPEKLYRDVLGAAQYGNIFSIDVGPDYAGRLREIDVQTLRKVGELIRSGATLPEPLRAFCVDFNWGPGGTNGFAPPGLWADADPAKHVAWYEALGANVVQTFAVSCNGYAWYKGGAIPAQPGLKSDFLPDVVKLGHAKKMQVMGYFCVGANTRWGAEHPDLSYGTPSAYHLPFTDEYLDYLAGAIEEGLTKSGMDGFMVDWVWNPADKVRGGKWLAAEKKLYEQLTGQPFPGEDTLTPAAKLAYERKALDRCWERIRTTAKRVKPSCVIWLSCNAVHDPSIAGSKLLKEVDWVMDESGHPEALRGVASMFGPQTRQLLCVVGWGDRHDARKICTDAANADYGIYGFARPSHDSLPLPIETYLKPPLESFAGNDRNIAILAHVFNGKPLPPPAALPIKASSVWGHGYEAAMAYDGDEATRWGAKPESRSGWLEIDLGKETTVGRAVVMELGYPRTQAFVIEYKAGKEWKPLYSGTTIAGARAYDFTPGSARYVRLNITKASEVPSIEEFHVYAPGAKLPEALEKAQQEEKERMTRTAWFREAKFGMFITWGLYSVPAGTWKGKELKHAYGEWIEWALPIPHDEYAGIATTWEPKQFDADAWVKIAKEAGMKYLLITAKFHDGFLMYPSRITAYNIHDCTPWKRDPVKELGDACARQGLKFGVYWNHVYDWQHPNGVVPGGKVREGGNLDKYIDEVSLPQLKEMLVDHPQISFIWFDQGGNSSESTYERGKKFADLIRSIRPEIIFNSRLGAYPSDYISMGDNGLPSNIPAGVWESPCTINHTWGFKAQDTDFKSAAALVFNLVDVVSKGGNYILNVGPTGDGVIPAPEVERLQAMGAWLKVNGESIYGAGRTPFGDELGGYDPAKKDSKGRAVFTAKSDWRCTAKPGKLYFIFFKWPGSAFEIGVSSKVVKAYLLTDRQTLAFAQQTGGSLSVALPARAPDSPATVLCLELEEPQ
jgi:alpha-L-fucosidase